MGKSKKISFTSIAIVVLAILLTVSLTMGGTLAWFANQNQAGTALTMGNAVGVAVVDKSSATGSMDKLSFTFHTGRNGELMLPGTQVDPNVQALVARSNTDTILRAVVSFEVSLSNRITDENLDEFEAAAGSSVYYDTTYQRNFVSVPSSIAGSNEDPEDEVQQELYLLNSMYKSFFATLQASALYNGWVYREANLFNGTDTQTTYVGSAKLASSKYYVSGLTQYQDKPIVATADRNAGIGRKQQTSASEAGTTELGYATDGSGAVTYNAFYFRGWSGTKAANHSGSETGTDGEYEIKYVDKGIDGIYAEKYSKGSLVSSVYDSGGRAYYSNRTDAAAGTGTAVTPLQVSGAKAEIGSKTEEYAILEGVYNETSKNIDTFADPLGYKKGDETSNGATGDSLLRLNVATDQDSWKTSGKQTNGEDMMCVINSKEMARLIPLFTTSFMLPSTWTQDAFADRVMKLNVTFQVMQADYLASGTSHHVSVELAESRFDDATIWAASADGAYSQNAPFIIDVNGDGKYNNPGFWTGEYPYVNDENITD